MNRLMQLLADNRKAPGREFSVRAMGADEAEILLYDAIVDSALEAEYWGGVAPEPFVAQLRAIDASTIHLRINSPGGSVFGARAIETALREHKAKIVVHIDGLAASAATFVAMAGDEVVMSKGAMFMVHNAWTFAYGNAAELKNTAALLEKIDGTLVATYADRSGQPPEQIANWMGAETWFTAEEAVQHGFADSVSEVDSKTGAKACGAAWSLKAYRNAPSQPNPEPAPPEPAAATPDHRARQQQRLTLLARTQIV